MSAYPMKEWAAQANSLPVEKVPVALIRDSYTPRKAAANERHIEILAQSPTPLPPIVIHRASMRVIDGVHRLRATQLRGDNSIAARFYDGSDAEAFVLAVHLNVTHGLPLTLPERKAAARRVLLSHPHWSDRSIGLVAGVSNKTVAKLRGCATEEDSHLDLRLGRDGKARPISPIDGRQRAAEFLSRNPDASLREIARKARVSVSTARDVRARIDRGDNPLPDSLAKTPSRHTEHVGGRPDVFGPGEQHDAWPPVPAEVQGHHLLRQLKNDPAVRFSERGRKLLRLLFTGMAAIDAVNEFADVIPIHCSDTVAEMARRNARAWQEIANKFDTLDTVVDSRRSS